MKRNFYRTNTYRADHSTFGGKIYPSDYDGHRSISDIAARILSDWKFDRECRQNGENRELRQEENRNA